MSPNEATDQLELRQLGYRYARAADRRDYEAFRDVFTNDGRVAGYDGDVASDAPTFEMVGVDEICKGMQGLDQYDRTFHFVGNQLVEIDGDTATGETYCVAHHLYDHDGVQMNYTMFIRYQDRCVREDGRWWYEERRLCVDWERHGPLGDEGWA